MIIIDYVDDKGVIRTLVVRNRVVARVLEETLASLPWVLLVIVSEF